MTTGAEPDEPKTPWWKIFAAAIEKLPLADQPERLAGLAQELIARKEPDAARQLALQAWRQLGNSSAGGEKFRAVLRALTPGYHLQITTDPNRIAAWEAALASVIRPGMLALEIGTGTGILAMLAARDGTEVVSCDKDILITTLAEETIQKNNLAGRIRVIAKSADELQIPADLPRQADLLILDLFGDRLFNFKPFEVIAAAEHLLRPDAVAVPMRVSLECALANFKRWSRLVPGKVAGLDLGVLAPLSSQQVSFDAADPDVSLLSPSETMVRAHLPDQLLPLTGMAEKALVSTGGAVNGLAVWLRLELAPGHVLEARPGSVPYGFYAKPIFSPLSAIRHTAAGEVCTVRLHWENKSLHAELVRPIAETVPIASP